MEHNITTSSSSTIGLSSGTIGLSSGTNYHTAPLTYNSGTTIYGGLTLNNNTSSMNQQTMVAVFQVERNKHNEIKSSTFIDQFWIEKKPGISIDFAVAKKLDGKYEADEIVIKEIYTITL